MNKTLRTGREDQNLPGDSPSTSAAGGHEVTCHCNKTFCFIFLKTLDTIGNCQRLFFSLGASQHIYIKQLTCEKLSSIGHRSGDFMDENKTPLSHEVIVCVHA